MNTRCRLLPWSLVLAATALTGVAWAGPRVTETADALARGDCELEVAASRESTSGTPVVRGLEATAGCGVGGDTQLGVGWARASLAGLHADGLARLSQLTPGTAAKLLI